MTQRPDSLSTLRHASTAMFNDTKFQVPAAQEVADRKHALREALMLAALNCTDNQLVLIAQALRHQ